MRSIVHLARYERRLLDSLRRQPSLCLAPLHAQRFLSGITSLDNRDRTMNIDTCIHILASIRPLMKSLITRFFNEAKSYRDGTQCRGRCSDLTLDSSE
jgi:hypothetical protein